MKYCNTKLGLMLNIGCGYTNTPGDWINIDNSFSAILARYPRIKKFLSRIKVIPKRLYDLPWPNNITVLDVRKGLPYKDKTVRYIYVSHFLEHLSKKDCECFLRECYRVMMKEGIIRIIVPDLQGLSQNYINKIKGIKKDAANITSPADEFIERLGLFDRAGEDDSFLIRFVKVLQSNKNIHKWMYDYYSLSLKLKQTGFVRITQKEYLDSAIEKIGILDNPDRFKYSLCVEASKA
ncbi:MAG: methyltransferase domain-containing protein [Candidatus Omnitrophica bacterium]|nr:methyltransferase domain-containing protein [Candidatus Omnitrophota bacterium]